MQDDINEMVDNTVESCFNKTMDDEGNPTAHQEHWLLVAMIVTLICILAMVCLYVYCWYKIPFYTFLGHCSLFIIWLIKKLL
jgi:hypothetical protein